MTATLEVRIYEVRQHLDEIMIMMDSGVFQFKNGVAELHRDNDGKLREVRITEKRYKA